MKLIELCKASLHFHVHRLGHESLKDYLLHRLSPPQAKHAGGQGPGQVDLVMEEGERLGVIGHNTPARARC